MLRLPPLGRRLLPLILSAAGMFAGHGAQAPSLPRLLCTAPDPETALLQWQSADGDGYQLERCPDLKAGDWFPAGDPFTGTGALLSFSEPKVPGQVFYRLQVTPALPIANKIAMMGDSITAQGSSNLAYLSAEGYYAWAQAFGGSRWNLASSGSSFRFATAGKRSDEVSALHRAQVLASGAQACVLAYGTNDAFQMVPVASFVNQAISDWQALRAGGIEPIAVTVLPIGSVTTYFSSAFLAARQARVAEYNVAIRQAAATHQVALCDWTTALEAVPGSNNGVGLDSHFTNNDNLHPKPLPASMMGRILSATIASHFRTTGNLWANGDWITPNTAFAGAAGQPHSQWNVYAPGGGTVVAKNLVASADGNWWEIEIAPGSSTSYFSVTCFGANLGGAPANKKVEAISEMQVIQGTLDSASLQLYTTGPMAMTLSSGERSGAQIRPEDGIIVLRTPTALLGSSVTQATPYLTFNTSLPEGAVLRIRRCGLRVVE